MFEKKLFTVNEDHLKLARRMIVRWDDSEYGAPAVDSKRPYGNSNVVGDIGEILGWQFDTDGMMNIAKEHEARAIHEEMGIVVQIAFATQQFATGNYECDRYTRDWKKVS